MRDQVVANYISRNPLYLRHRKAWQPARQTEDGFYTLFLFERPEHTCSEVARRPYDHDSHAGPLPWSPADETRRGMLYHRPRARQGGSMRGAVRGAPRQVGRATVD